MGLTDKLISKMGTSSVKLDIEVLDRHIFHKTPFTVRLTLKAGKDPMHINSMETSFIWREFKVSEYHHDHQTYQKSRNEWYEKHILQKSLVTIPFDLAPHQVHSLEITFSTNMAKGSRFPDEFFIKVHVDIPKVIDIRESQKIEVLPYAALSAPMIAMTDELGFSRKPWKKRDDTIIPRNRWWMIPDHERYPHIDRVFLSVDDPRNRELDILLRFKMYEFPGRSSKGIHEEMERSCQLSPVFYLPHHFQGQDGTEATVSRYEGPHT